MTKSREQFVVDEKGNRTGVLLPVEDYEKLLEDLHDLAVVAECREESTLTLEEIRERLEGDGLL